MAYNKAQIESIFDYICSEIENGRPVRQVLRDEDMPSTRIFFKWLDEDETKVKRYARACSLRADLIFDDMFDIADNQESDVLKNAEGIEYTNHNVIQRARLRIDTRKWVLSKMNPKKYGDKIDHTSAGNELKGFSIEWGDHKIDV